LPPSEAVELLPRLPAGSAILSTGRGPSRRLLEVGAPLPPDPAGWARALQRTAEEFPAPPEADRALDGGLDSEILLAVVGLEARREPADARTVSRWLALAPGASADPAAVPARLPVLRHRGWLDGAIDGPLALTDAGRRYLACDGRTGATRETAEHRALLLGAFRILAARGYKLEILRQGRFDTQLPDARLALLTRRAPGPVRPSTQAAAVDRARAGWAWKFFGGRDVHFEAEVSGALRRDRIRHDLSKSRRAETFLVVLVGDARRAGFVRRALVELTSVPSAAQVWTIPEAARLRPARGLASAEEPAPL
jgi:hypothetical protein